MHDHKLEGLSLDIEIRPKLAGDVCNTTKPSAHHWVKSNLKICSKFFTTTQNNQARLIVHELLHHLFVPWKTEKGAHRLSPLKDTHTHGHGKSCTSNIETDKGYGIEKVRHFGGYTASDGGTCWHRNFAFRNNDTYAQAAMFIGGNVRDGTSQYWPVSHPDNPPSGPIYVACESGNHLPPPSNDWYDPINDCHKENMEVVCPGSGPQGTGASHVSPSLDIAIECPPEF